MASPAHSYDPQFFAHLAEAEDRHFWFRTRNEVIAALIGRLVEPLPDGFRVLEIGCGTGNTLRVLQRTCRRGSVFGMDLYAEGLRFASRRATCPVIQADLHRPPVRAGFDLVCLFDVLEHIPDDDRVLVDIATMLKPGGRLVMTVPAHMALWSYFDQASHHCRRYDGRSLRLKLESAGFRVEFLSEFMAALYPLVWLGRRIASIARGRGRGDEPEIHVRDLALRELNVIPIINQLLIWALKPEVGWLRAGRSLPLGTSLATVARRPG